MVEALNDLTVLRQLAERGAGFSTGEEAKVRAILNDVRTRGDRAVLEYTRRFDFPLIKRTGLRVHEAEVRKAYTSVSRAFLTSLRRARKNIIAFHSKQLPRPVRFRNGGLTASQRFLPLTRVGIYVPGGKAAYPSTVLMNAVPAALAGVKEVALSTPCDGRGKIAPEVLVAAHECGVTEMYRMGGAQAIAAFAYGTESIRRVDKITGPGNMYVAIAKRLVFGTTGIDAIAGPTEVMIVADETARPELVAADLIAQAEHDEQAFPICVSTSVRLLRQVELAVQQQLENAPRRRIAEASLNHRGLLVHVGSLTRAAEVVNLFAPEHCEIMTKHPRSLASRISAAGAVFVGEWSTEALGDYVAGPNHTLPTSGTARFSSALSTLDFMRSSTLIECTRREFLKLAPVVETLAEAEGLHGHAASMTIRRTADE